MLLINRIRNLSTCLLFNGFKSVNSFLFCPYGRSSFILKMSGNPEVYLRIEEESEKFRISFQYCGSDPGNSRDYHFHRNLGENVQGLCNRISLKLNPPRSKKKHQMNQFEDIKIPVQLMKNGIPVCSTTSCKEVFCSDYSELKLKIGDKELPFVVNVPWIESLTLPKCIMAGCMIYPQKLEGLFIDESESKFMWYRCVDDVEELVGSDLFYVPTTADIGHTLKLQCIPIHQGLEGPMVEIYSSCEVEAGPGYCPFEDRHIFTKNNLLGNSFRVVSYNILAELYASSTTGKEALFAYCPPYALTMDYRKHLLFKELIGYNADVICLQEVDLGVFRRDLKRILNKFNMDGILTKKGGQVNEGVACFYNRSRLRLESSFFRFLNEDLSNDEFSKTIWTSVNTNDNLRSRLSDRTTVVQVLVFDYLDKPKHKLIVANTHLYFHPEADHIRLLQAGLCLHYIEDIVKNFKSKDQDSIFSVIFCGDFNSTPECGVYQLFTTGEVSSDHNEWKSGDETVENLSLHSPFNFSSACGVPEFTNFTYVFKGCLDYIFYETDYLRVDQVIPFPPEEEVSRHTAIPSIVFPSDHVALVADLSWTC